VRIFRQIGLILLLCVVCEGIAVVLHFPFPGSVLSMLVMLALFCTKLLRPEQLKETSGFLLGHMMLVFLPSFVSIVNHAALLKEIWVRFVLVIVISTVVTFFVAGSVVALVIRIQKQLTEKKGDERCV